MNKFYLLLLLLLPSSKIFSANVTIIQSTNPLWTSDIVWRDVAINMGHNATIVLDTVLDNTFFLSNTDVLITPEYNLTYTPVRINNIISFLQSGKSVYIQSEYDLSFNGNQAYQTLVNSLGGSFTWTGTVSGVLAPMNVLGSLATTPLTIPPLTYFWYGCDATVCNFFDSFLEFGGQYFGFTFCPPVSTTGRIMTTSDQDWVIQMTSTDMIHNMLSLLLTPPSACGFNATTISLGNDTSLCDGNSLLLGTGISATSYLWSTGASTSVILVDTSATYWLQITAGGCTAFDTIDVQFIPCAINALFDPADSLICPGTCTNFTDLSLNAATYQWSFPGGNPAVSADQNPSGICYNSPGAYDVTLIITNGNLTDTMLISNCINVLPFPAPQGILQSGDTLFANQGAASYQWYHDGNLIAGATDYFYLATASGNFNVVCIDGNGCEVEAVIFDVIAGTSSINGIQSITIMPNPADETLQLSSPQPVNVCIKDALGKSVYISNSADKKFTIETSGFDSGVYLLIYSGESFTLTEKIIISHR
jgi:hypothetical protein